MITLSEQAAAYIGKQVAGKGVGFRIGLRKAGCSGYAYALDVASEILDSDEIFESHGVKVLVHRDNLPQLDGMKVDYVREGLNSILKFDNPNVKNQCGCGESFGL